MGKRVLTATMRRGDILLFDQYAYHRGLPNVTPNRTRWSLDFRFQRADERTLRVEQGFLLDGSDTSLKSTNDWVSAVPSLRLSEARAKSGNVARRPRVRARACTRSRAPGGRRHETGQGS